ncbi:hypothetical protein JW935_20930 [candidate division KSB1 bacterium]|nr:hypothetical protein [candidate division KSB1 bacterium]
MTRKYLLFLWIFFILMSGCGTKRNNDMTFKVNPSLLEPVYKNEELGFSFCAPKGCKDIASDVFDAAKQQLQNQVSASDSFYLSVEKINYNPDEQFLCVVSSLPQFQGKSGVSDYLMVIAEKFENSNLRQNVFTYHGFTIHQTLVMTDDKTIFKLFIPQADFKSFQIDFIVDKNNYQKNLEAIESSIGSLEKI